MFGVGVGGSCSIGKRRMAGGSAGAGGGCAPSRAGCRPREPGRPRLAGKFQDECLCYRNLLSHDVLFVGISGTLLSVVRSAMQARDAGMEAGERRSELLYVYYTTIVI